MQKTTDFKHKTVDIKLKLWYNVIEIKREEKTKMKKQFEITYENGEKIIIVTDNKGIANIAMYDLLIVDIKEV